MAVSYYREGAARSIPGWCGKIEMKVEISGWGVSPGAATTCVNLMSCVDGSLIAPRTFVRAIGKPNVNGHKAMVKLCV